MILWLDNSFLSDTLLSPRPQNAAVESKFMKGSWKYCSLWPFQRRVAAAHQGAFLPRQREISPLIMRMCMTAWFKERQWDRLYFHHRRHQRHRKAPLQRQWGRRSLVLLTRCKKKWSGVSKTPLKNDNILLQIVVWSLKPLVGPLTYTNNQKWSTVLHSQSFPCHKHFSQNRKRIYGSNKCVISFFFRFIVGGVSADVVMDEKAVKNIPFLVIYGRKRGLTQTFVPPFFIELSWMKCGVNQEEDCLINLRNPADPSVSRLLTHAVRHKTLV